MAILVTGAVLFPGKTADWGATPRDKAHEDLSRFVYPSQDKIKWRPYFIRPQDTVERLFGKNWLIVCRFNKIDRMHAYPGMTLKVPERMSDILNYTPSPAVYDPAKPYRRYILVDMSEQWLGAYEYGRLVFSMPAATGVKDHPTPSGLFLIDAHDRSHSSSLYKTIKEDRQYPMDYALRFHIDASNVGFWIHARDIPGRPASHGCIGLTDEFMQNRIYDGPLDPMVNDAKKLYEWVLGQDYLAFDSGGPTLILDGPRLEIKGSLPIYLDKHPDLISWPEPPQDIWK